MDVITGKFTSSEYLLLIFSATCTTYDNIDISIYIPATSSFGAMGDSSFEVIILHNDGN
jgi:hypothetical protein